MVVPTNGNDTWTRWAIGIIMAVLLAMNAWSTTRVWANAVGVAQNTTAIRSLDKRFDRLESKIDRLLEVRGVVWEPQHTEVNDGRS